MSKEKLKSFLDQDHTKFKLLLKEAVINHITELTAANNDLYGYAIQLGESYDEMQPVGLYNRESDLSNPIDSYRLSPDEWRGWEADPFELVSAEIESLNEQFQAVHENERDDFEFDEDEIQYIKKFHSDTLSVLKELKDEGFFNSLQDSIILIWLTDSDYELKEKSVALLNSTEIHTRFINQ